MGDARWIHDQQRRSRGAGEGAVQARPEGLAELHAAFDRFFAQAEKQVAAIRSADRVAILTAAGEVAANIIEHACGHLPDATMSLVVLGHRDHIEVAFEDPGVPYDGAENAPEPEADLPQGGFGLRVARASLDTLEYVRGADGVNRWRLVRRVRGRRARS